MCENPGGFGLAWLVTSISSRLQCMWRRYIGLEGGFYFPVTVIKRDCESSQAGLVISWWCGVMVFCRGCIIYIVGSSLL